MYIYRHFSTSDICTESSTTAQSTNESLLLCMLMLKNGNWRGGKKRLVLAHQCYRTMYNTNLKAPIKYNINDISDSEEMKFWKKYIEWHCL